MTEETKNYFILYADHKGIVSDYLEPYEGDENLKDGIVGTFNHFLRDRYEDFTEEDYEEVMENIIVCEVVDKSFLIEQTIQKYLKQSDDEEHKEYLRLKKKFEKEKVK
jgi:predicted metallo-beta-lactamase superfamily hydrolase